MQLKLTNSEYELLGRRLERLTQYSLGRTREQLNLIKETAAKFKGERQLDLDGNITIPVQRRHLRLLEEIQQLSIKALEEGTLKELERRIAEGKGEPGYYEDKLEAAKNLLDSTKQLLNKLEDCL